MKKQHLIAVAAAGAVVVVSMWYMSRPAVAPVDEVDATVQIRTGALHLVTVPAGTTALALTKKVAEVKTEGEGVVALVTAIDGVVADTGQQQLWKLVVNDTVVQVSAGSYRVQEGDRIHWVLYTFK